MDRLAHSIKFSGNFQIGKPEDMESLGFQIFGADTVFFDFLGIVVLGSVQFYDQFCFVTVEIRNVISDYVLSAKLEGVFAEKIVPEQEFFFCRGGAKLSGKRFQISVSFHGYLFSFRVEGWEEAFGFAVSAGYRPHSSSAPPGHLPPGGRDRLESLAEASRVNHLFTIHSYLFPISLSPPWKPRRGEI